MIFGWLRVGGVVFGVALGVALGVGTVCGTAWGQGLGGFDGQGDVGTVSVAGTGVFAAGTYTLTGAGANIWGSKDAFHYAWKKVSGDVAVEAEIAFPVKTGTHDMHRKAVLMVRQSLDEDAVYADAALHGSGLVALQWRAARGGMTDDIELDGTETARLRLEKRGDTVTMFRSTHREAMHQVGASMKVRLDGEYLVGIGVSAHDAKAVETAVFTGVEVKALPSVAGEGVLYSTLKTVGLGSETRQTVVYTEKGKFEAPNWSKDGKSLVFDSGGKMMRVPVSGGIGPEVVDVGAATKCNGSHGFSPDGRLLGITCAMPDRPEPRVYVVPAGGGTPRVVTEHGSSYWHSWSPDGKTIAFTRPRKPAGGDIFLISAEGGIEERMLTPGTGVDDDPDFSPDGKYIYFNSDRTGSAQIWRMLVDGSGAEQVTTDDRVNWTPHVSPDGKRMVYTSYEKGTTGHPVNRDVELRVMTLADRKIETVVPIVGGGGTMNVNSWAPDSKHFAFVSYVMLPE